MFRSNVTEEGDLNVSVCSSELQGKKEVGLKCRMWRQSWCSSNYFVMKKQHEGFRKEGASKS